MPKKAKSGVVSAQGSLDQSQVKPEGDAGKTPLLMAG